MKIGLLNVRIHISKNTVTVDAIGNHKNEWQALLGYKSAMAQAHLMRSKGLISAEEFGIIETKMCGIFGINFDSLYRENDWIIRATDGNIAPDKEVV